MALHVGCAVKKLDIKAQKLLGPKINCRALQLKTCGSGPKHVYIRTQIKQIGPQSHILGQGSKYYRRTGLLYIITHPACVARRPNHSAKLSIGVIEGAIGTGPQKAGYDSV